MRYELQTTRNQLPTLNSEIVGGGGGGVDVVCLRGEGALRSRSNQCHCQGHTKVNVPDLDAETSHPYATLLTTPISKFSAPVPYSMPPSHIRVFQV